MNTSIAWSSIQKLTGFPIWSIPDSSRSKTKTRLQDRFNVSQLSQAAICIKHFYWAILVGTIVFGEGI